MGAHNSVYAHPVLFGLISILAAVEIGLSAYRVHWFNDHNAWPGSEFKNRLIFILFVACWTLLGAVLHWLISLWVGMFWTTLTLIFWIIAAALFHNVDGHPKVSDCEGTGISSLCRQILAIEAIGWTEVALVVLLFLALLFHCNNRRRAKTGYSNGLYDV